MMNFQPTIQPRNKFFRILLDTSNEDDFISKLKQIKMELSKKQFREFLSSQFDSDEGLIDIADRLNYKVAKHTIELFKDQMFEDLRLDLFFSARMMDLEKFEELITELKKEIYVDAKKVNSNKFFEIINARNNGKSLLHEVIGYSPIKDISTRYQKFKMVWLLIVHGANLDVYDDNHSTPLNLAQQIGETDLVNFIKMRQELIDQVNDLNVELSYELTLSSVLNLNLKKQNKCVTVLGDMGVGKSTFLNYLNGIDYEHIGNCPYAPNVFPVKNAKEDFPVGRGVIAETLMPFGKKIRNLFFVDTVGIDGNRGILELPGLLYLNLLKEKCESIILIYMIEANSFVAGKKSTAILKASDKISSILQDNFSLEDSNNILLVISKSCDIEHKFVLEGITEVKQQAKNYNIDGRKALPILSALSEEPSHVIIPDVVEPNFRNKFFDNLMSLKGISSDHLDFNYIGANLLNEFDVISTKLLYLYLQLNSETLGIPGTVAEIDKYIASSKIKLVQINNNIEYAKQQISLLTDQGYIDILTTNNQYNKDQIYNKHIEIDKYKNFIITCTSINNIIYNSLAIPLGLSISLKLGNMVSEEIEKKEKENEKNIVLSALTFLPAKYRKYISVLLTATICFALAYYTFRFIFWMMQASYCLVNRLRYEKYIIPKLENEIDSLSKSIKTEDQRLKEIENHQENVRLQSSLAEELSDSILNENRRKLNLVAKNKDNCLILKTNQHLFYQLKQLAELGVITKQRIPTVDEFIHQAQQSLIPNSCDDYYFSRISKGSYNILPVVEAYEVENVQSLLQSSQLEVSHFSAKLHNALEFTDENWFCVYQTENQMVCSNLNKLRIVFSNIPRFWQTITGDEFTKCRSLEYYGNQARFCEGRSTKFVEIDSPVEYRTDFLSINLMASLRGALYTAVPEFIGDMLRLTNCGNKKHVGYAKLISSLAIIFITGSFLSILLAQLMFLLLRNFGCSEKTATMSATVVSIGVQLANNISPTAVSATIAAYAGGKIGLWAEKRAIEMIESRMNVPTAFLDKERKPSIITPT